MENKFKKLLGMTAGILLGAILYGSGEYIITGHIDHLVKNSIVCLIGSLIVFYIVITTRPR